MKTDLREYSDLELTLLVYNDEDLYKQRKDKNFLSTLDNQFVYTEQQMRILKRDLNSEDK